MDRASLDGLDVPSDIWWRIMAECGPCEIRSLAQSCRLFHELSESRTVWLRCIQNLGPHQPPGIPKYVSLSTFSTPELCNIASNAYRRCLDWISDSSPKLKREMVISLKDANPDEILGEPSEFGLQLFLLPGGEYLLILWPAGYLQCWSVRDKSCLWVYPDLPEGASEDRPKLLWTFDYDMQKNGDIDLLLIDERLQGEEMGDMYPSIVRFCSGSSTFEKLYSGQRLNSTYGAPLISRSRGNLLIVYQQPWGLPLGTMTIHFRAENKSLEVCDINIECLEAVDGFIIYASNLGNGNKSLNVLLIDDLLRVASGSRARVPCVDVLSAAVLIEPKSFSLQRGQLTVNTLHWKAKADQDRIYITLLYKDKISKGTPFARFVLNKAVERSATSIWPLLTIYSLDDYDDDISLELSGRTFTSYTTVTPPTLSGQSLALLHSSNLPSESDDALALAMQTPDSRNKFRLLDLGVDYHETEAICNEFYSGAVLFATKDYDSVIIRYFE